jgi:hypothetical protein
MSDKIAPDRTEKLDVMMEAFQATVAAETEKLNKIAVAAQATIKASLDRLNLPNLAELGKRITEQVNRAIPDNWPEGALGSHSTIEEVLETDGIPIVHIPRAAIVAQLLAAATFENRVKIIEDRADDIAQDCKDALTATFHTSIEEQAPLALNAVESFVDGYHAPAQALAVAVCDTYLKSYLQVGYRKMAERVTIEESNKLPLYEALNFFYPFAPVVSFLTKWFPDGTTLPPTKLSRHVSVHNASTTHMTKLYATIAIMLATSLTVAIDKMERLSDSRNSQN